MAGDKIYTQDDFVRFEQEMRKRMEDEAKASSDFGKGGNLFSDLARLFLGVFRQDYYVDFQEQQFAQDASDPTKVFNIIVRECHGVQIKNTGTGRIRLFSNYWLEAGEWWSDQNDHYRKYWRYIPLLLADPFNDAEGYAGTHASIKTHSVLVITKHVNSRR